MVSSLSRYESQQRQRNITTLIIVEMVVSFALGFWDIQFRTSYAVIGSIFMGLSCIPLLLLSRRMHFTLTGLLVSAIALVVIFVNLFDGDGVYDSGMLAYPVYILIGTLMFGKKSAPYFVLTALGSVAGLTVLQQAGYIRPTVGGINIGYLVPVSLLFLFSGIVVWVIINNADKNLQMVKDSQAELEWNYDQTLEAWAKVLEIRDRETEGHSRRLVETSTLLAHALGLSETDIVNLQRGALLHDIGKLAVPDQILLKKGPLDEIEKEIIHKHPSDAINMLKGIKFLEPSMAVAYSHHERWDGNGYPDGLKGEQIPLLARIFAIVDNWDALGSERPYRHAWSQEKIREYLRENSGRIFDPHIVDVFLNLI
jgi:putative nucleotidyltransferase with HDIG domain